MKKLGFVSCLWSKDVDLWSFERLDFPWLIWIFKLIHRSSSTTERFVQYINGIAEQKWIWKHDWDKNYIKNCIFKILCMLIRTLYIILIPMQDIRLQSFWWHHYVGDFMRVPYLRCWWQSERQLSSSHFVSNIRHQHRCNRISCFGIRINYVESSNKHAQDFKDAILDIIFVSVMFSNLFYSANVLVTSLRCWWPIQSVGDQFKAFNSLRKSPT